MAYNLDEIKGYERLRTTLVEKLTSLQLALLLETDASRKFAYEQEIRDLENQKVRIDNTLAEAYDLDTDSGKERLREKFKNLIIPGPMGRLHLVNCDRKQVRDRFEEGFDRRKALGANNHFYFLSACPTQLPPSLGERMVYELLGDILEDGRSAVYCRFNAINHDRVRLEELPLGYSFEKSQQLFREYCADRFGWDKKLSFEEAVGANLLPMAKHEYTVLPFFLHKSDWQPFFAEYFDWIARSLSARPAVGPTLLVFIVLYIDKLHVSFDPKTRKISDPESAAIVADIDGICERHPNAGHFYPLDPVEESDLIKWFNKLGEMNNARIRPVLDTVVESLPTEELKQYRQPKEVKINATTGQPEPPEEAKLLNMDRIELVQELVYDLYNKIK